MKRAQDFKGLSKEDVGSELKKLREELVTLRFQHAVHQLKNPLRLRWVRRNIARASQALAEGANRA